jgi:hypothetical protein
MLNRLRDVPPICEATKAWPVSTIKLAQVTVEDAASFVSVSPLRSERNRTNGD